MLNFISLAVTELAGGIYNVPSRPVAVTLPLVGVVSTDDNSAYDTNEGQCHGDRS